MKLLKLALVINLGVIGLCGCTTLSGLLGKNVNADIDKYGKQLADAYCQQPLAVRQSDSRPRVNEAIAPHHIELDCKGDPANP